MDRGNIRAAFQQMEKPYRLIYEYDFKNKTQDLQGVVGLCKECHLYIHEGFLNVQLNTGKISSEKYNEIIDKGNRLLREAGLFRDDNWKAFYEDNWIAVWRVEQ